MINIGSVTQALGGPFEQRHALGDERGRHGPRRALLRQRRQPAHGARRHAGAHVRDARAHAARQRRLERRLPWLRELFLTPKQK